MTHVLKEDLEHAASLFIDETGNTLHTTTTRETTDGRFSDTLDVVTKNFPVAFRATLSETLAALSGDRNLERVGREI